MLDTGSSVTVMTKALMDELPYEITTSSRTKLNAFGQGKYPSIGIVENMEFFIGNVKTKANVEVVDFQEKIFLLGTDWMKKEKAKLDYNKDILTIQKNGRDNLVPIYYKEEIPETEEEYESDEEHGLC